MMAHTKPSSTVLILVLFTTTLSSPLKILQQVEAEAEGDDDCPWYTKQYEVSVSNEIKESSTPLIVHCASGDRDLGKRTLTNQYPGSYWSWKFCGDAFGRTMYFCHFWWGKKDRAFEVFNYDLIKKECGTVCVWDVKPDGFYVRDGAHLPAKKKYDWRN